MKAKQQQQPQVSNETKMLNILKLYVRCIQTPQIMIKEDRNIHVTEDPNPELELRFTSRKGKTYLNNNTAHKIKKSDYHNVIHKITSLGYTTDSPEGMYLLRINNEFKDKQGKIHSSDIRAELEGMDFIHQYCKLNDFTIEDYKKLKFTQKKRANKDSTVDVDDFGFRLSLQIETDYKVRSDLIQNTLRAWRDTKKTFRYLNRVRFSHPDIPVFVDLSIVKSSKKDESVADKDRMIPTYNIQESGVFTDIESYEIELEVDNSRIGQLHPTHNTDAIIAKLMTTLRRLIRHILSAFQFTNYPISFGEMDIVKRGYLHLLHGNRDTREVTIQDFIGPSSQTLQIEHLYTNDSDAPPPAATNEKTDAPIIVQKDMTVTEKADGERRLLYFHNTKKIYMIDTNMNVIFTGYEVKTKSPRIKEALLDGEFIKHNKFANTLNLYACFDIYFVEGDNVRLLPFIPLSPPDNSRLNKLQEFVQSMQIGPVVQDGGFRGCEFRIQVKHFEIIQEETHPLYQACSKVLQKTFEYNTDGLIFTPSYLGVGIDNPQIKQSPLRKTTWLHSLKWKPSEYNTIDFLVSVKKDNRGDDLIETFVNGDSIQRYKTLHLLCGFDTKKHKSINMFYEMIQQLAKGPANENRTSADDESSAQSYNPVPFQPTEPFDAHAYICHIPLIGGDVMRSEEGEFFEEYMIVEFRYEMSNHRYWRWIPLRVRHDKTMELRNGQRNFGNAYHVANSIWNSIHNPITEKMLQDPAELPASLFDAVEKTIYYNANHVSKSSEKMREFHNFVKSKLINAVAVPGNILIDYACGRGGDVSKWFGRKLKFVLGLDYNQNNLLNAKDGACKRYVDMKKQIYNTTQCVFLQADSSKNIRSSGEAFQVGGENAQLHKEIAFTLFKNFTNDAQHREHLGIYEDAVMNYQGVAKNGFHVSSIQFALHYFFENKKSLLELCRNLCECTCDNGYVIGCCYDGEAVYKLLSGLSIGQEYTINHQSGGHTMLAIRKQYESTGREFTADEDSLGLTIEVYQDSIGKYFPEYLVNFTYFIELMTLFGFTQLNEKECLEKIEVRNSVGSFRDLYLKMEEEEAKKVEKNKFSQMTEKAEKDKKHKFIKMCEEEQKISFLNKYFVFKKTSNIPNVQQMVHSMV